MKTKINRHIPPSFSHSISDSNSTTQAEVEASPTEAEEILPTEAEFGEELHIASHPDPRVMNDCFTEAKVSPRCSPKKVQSRTRRRAYAHSRSLQSNVKTSHTQAPKTTVQAQTHSKTKSVQSKAQVASVQYQDTVSATMQRKIFKLVSSFESKGNYGLVNTNLKGGIAYGVLQLLSTHGGVGRLLKAYSQAGGKYAAQLAAFGDPKNPHVAKNPAFQKLLKQAGNDPIMQNAQREIFSKEYLRPALKFGREVGLKNPASYAVLFDSFIHYGKKRWLKRKIKRWVKRYGEVGGLKRYTQWMERQLRKRYSRTSGPQSIQVKYNTWRARFLQTQLMKNPQLSGTISMKAPQWRRPVLIQ